MLLDAIDVTALPWIRPLVSAHANAYSSVAALFAGDPHDAAAWQSTITRVQRAPRQQHLIADVLARQLERRGAPSQARRAAEQLARPDAVAVVTGQQVGLFGGPFYTLLKAITAIALARRLGEAHGVPVVPVFWADAEDHDWDEVNTVKILGRDDQIAAMSLPSPTGAGRGPCGSLRVPEGVDAVALLAAALPATDFTEALIASLGRRYASGERLGTAFAGWLDELVGPLGMPVFEADDSAAKAAVADVFVHELMAPHRTARLVQSAGAMMRVLGHTPQLELDDRVCNLFYLQADRRIPIKTQGADYEVGDQVRRIDDLVAEARQHPERFSPNVVTRPIVQDHLFPTVCYVAGPSELAYHAQLGTVYREFGVERPLHVSRATATLLDSPCRRLLERQEVTFAALQPQDDSLLNKLIADRLPKSIDSTIQTMRTEAAERTQQLRQQVVTIDPTLGAVVDTTLSKFDASLDSLQNKIVQAGKRKDDVLRRQFQHARALAFPAGQPQERCLNLAFFINRHGLSLAELLLRHLPPDPGKHFLIAL